MSHAVPLDADADGNAFTGRLSDNASASTTHSAETRLFSNEDKGYLLLYSTNCT